jgi:hypothetical protein
VAASTFAEPGRVESTAVQEAMSALSPPQRQAAQAPYSLSGPGGLEAVCAAIEKAVMPFTDPVTGGDQHEERVPVGQCSKVSAAKVSARRL